MTRRLRYGMIGGGPGSFIGPVHRIAARIDDRFTLVAGAFSSDPDRAAQAGRDTHVDPDRSYARWEEMISRESALPADSRPDLISIVTPNHLHAGPAIAALDAGFHVICDKPLAASLEEAERIADAVHRSGRLFALTYTYSGYPMVRQMRAMIAQGMLGSLRMVQVHYAQDWLTRPIEKDGNRQAAWRTDPARSGQGGALGDIGTHAYHLVEFTTGLVADELCADLSSFGEGRSLDDNAHVLLRYPGGVRGMLWASQVAPGRGNDLSIQVFGSEGGIEWRQEQPNTLRLTRHGEPSEILERGGPSPGAAAAYTTRVPGHHPEGYLEAFAQIYGDVAEQIAARCDGRAADPLACCVPAIEDGLEGMRFVAGAIRSSSARRWIPRDSWA